MSRIKLTDIAPRTTVVKISAGEIEVGKISAGEIAALALRFPALAALVGAEGSGPAVAKLLSEAAPEALPAIVAMACGMPGRRGEEGAKSLLAVDQLKILAEIAENSFPDGIASFFEALEELSAKIAPEQEEGEEDLGALLEQVKRDAEAAGV